MIGCLLYSISHDPPLVWIAKPSTAASPEGREGPTSVCQQVWDIVKKSGYAYDILATLYAFEVRSICAEFHPYFQDHAPGQILVEEAGGVVTDSRGQHLDFGLGRTLGENFGVIAAGKGVHAQVLRAVQSALSETKAKV